MQKGKLEFRSRGCFGPAAGGPFFNGSVHPTIVDFTIFPWVHRMYVLEEFRGFVLAEKEHGMLLPYGMQLGSGTWDLKPGITWLAQCDDFSLGAQAMGTVRLENENDAGYALGDKLDVTAWAARKLNESISA